MTLNQMRYFITTAEFLSFTEAAKHLFLTQPALSRQIAAMEQELNTQLFIREKNGLKLTPGGIVLYNKLPDILKQYNQLVEQSQNANQGYEGTLKIGFLNVYDTSMYFTNCIKQFTLKYPKIQLTMECQSTADLITKLNNKELDLIVTYAFSLYEQPDLVITNIHKFHTCLMVPTTHPLAQQHSLNIHDLNSESIVLLHQKENPEGTRYLKSLFAKGGVHPVSKIVNKMEDMMLWMGQENHMSLTTDVTMERNNPNVKIIPFEPVEEHDMAVAWNKQNYNPSIAMFMEQYELSN